MLQYKHQAKSVKNKKKKAIHRIKYECYKSAVNYLTNGLDNRNVDLLRLFS